jgi:hypothetical protein
VQALRGQRPLPDAWQTPTNEDASKAKQFLRDAADRWHIALSDATGGKPGIVVCEVPAKPQRCEIRTTVFSWTRTRFPLHIRSTRKLTINQAPVITVIGKAFWDIGHAPKDGSNRRKRLPEFAVWEIHPVMRLDVL